MKRIGAAYQETFGSQIKYSETIFFARSDMEDRRYAIWAVNCNWNSSNGYWKVEANPVTNPNEWNDGNQVVSRDSILFFRFGGSFCYQVSSPSADHFSNFFYILAD